MEHPSSWDKNLPPAEFSYNNSYQESQDGTVGSLVWTSLPHTAQLDLAKRKCYIWSLSHR
jgi:hypothetical protein